MICPHLLCSDSDAITYFPCLQCSYLCRIVCRHLSAWCIGLTVLEIFYQKLNCAQDMYWGGWYVIMYECGLCTCKRFHDDSEPVKSPPIFIFSSPSQLSQVTRLSRRKIFVSQHCQLHISNLNLFHGLRDSKKKSWKLTVGTLVPGETSNRRKSDAVHWISAGRRVVRLDGAFRH